MQTNHRRKNPRNPTRRSKFRLPAYLSWESPEESFWCRHISWRKMRQLERQLIPRGLEDLIPRKLKYGNRWWYP